jgi:hypothetical protein
MDSKKKNPSVDTDKSAEPQTADKHPIKVLSADDVSASVFRRTAMIRGEERTFYSVSFSRSYRDAHGTWRYIKSFGLEDLGKVITVAQQADEYIRSLAA